MRCRFLIIGLVLLVSFVASVTAKPPPPPPPPSITFTFINDTDHTVKISSSVLCMYTPSSVSVPGLTITTTGERTITNQFIDVEKELPPGGRHTETRTYEFYYKISGAAGSVYWNGRTERQDSNPGAQVKTVTVRAISSAPWVQTTATK
ncbi:MAG TPA: hypothetical protein PKO06_09240 [Candidatus Ozemobacteraceae bacterium]|nr:hypothetical protein [Candidatus Ozemobacteraceae bacterium]